MWYFCWILGIGVALGFGIINAMWLDNEGDLARMRGDGLGGSAAGPHGDPD
jgi:cyd operon protein YbgT